MDWLFLICFLLFLLAASPFCVLGVDDLVAHPLDTIRRIDQLYDQRTLLPVRP